MFPAKITFYTYRLSLVSCLVLSSVNLYVNWFAWAEIGPLVHCKPFALKAEQMFPLRESCNCSYHGEDLVWTYFSSISCGLKDLGFACASLMYAFLSRLPTKILILDSTKPTLKWNHMVIIKNENKSLWPWRTYFYFFLSLDTLIKKVCVTSSF